MYVATHTTREIQRISNSRSPSSRYIPSRIGHDGILYLHIYPHPSQTPAHSLYACMHACTYNCHPPPSKQTSGHPSAADASHDARESDQYTSSRMHVRALELATVAIRVEKFAMSSCSWEVGGRKGAWRRRRLSHAAKRRVARLSYVCMCAS
jgi:hypothetical protein